MKKTFLFIFIICVPMSLMAIKKSCNYLNQIKYGMTTKQVYEILGEPVAKRKIDKNGTTIVRQVYILCHYNSVQTTEPYYIDFRNDSTIDRGITNRSNSDALSVPFGMPFSENNDEWNEIQRGQVLVSTIDTTDNKEFQQKLERLNKLYEQNMITADEYVQMKRELIMQAL